MHLVLCNGLPAAPLSVDIVTPALALWRLLMMMPQAWTLTLLWMLTQVVAPLSSWSLVKSALSAISLVTSFVFSGTNDLVMLTLDVCPRCVGMQLGRHRLRSLLSLVPALPAPRLSFAKPVEGRAQPVVLLSVVRVSVLTWVSWLRPPPPTALARIVSRARAVRRAAA